MRFGSIIVAGLAAVAAAMPAKEVSSNIDTVTALSRDLQEPAKQLSVVDGPLLLAGQGNFPPIIQGFQEIIQTVSMYISQMTPEKYSGNGADAIFNSFRTFVLIHQELLNILIGKSGLFATVPFIGEPMASVLRSVEAGVDALAFGIIDMMEDHVKDMQANADALGSTLDTAIDSYNGLNA